MTQHPPLSAVRLVIGLGNPGEKYRRTYHNTGAAFLDRLAAPGPDGPPPAKKRRHFIYVKQGGWTLAWPVMFMNESGIAVAEAARYFRVPPQAVLVVHDDSDLALGSFKFAFGAGAAGHRGVQSIIQTLGTKEFWRLRIGIRSHRGKAGTFVLRAPSADEWKTLQFALGAASVKLTENCRP